MNEILINLLHKLYLSKLATNSKRSKFNNQAIPKIIGTTAKNILDDKDKDFNLYI